MNKISTILILLLSLFLFGACDQNSEPEFNLKPDPAATEALNGSWVSVNNSNIVMEFNSGEFLHSSSIQEKKGIVEKATDDTINCYTLYWRFKGGMDWVYYKDEGYVYPSVMPMRYEVNGNTLTLSSTDGSGTPEVFTKQ